MYFDSLDKVNIKCITKPALETVLFPLSSTLLMNKNTQRRNNSLGQQVGRQNDLIELAQICLSSGPSDGWRSDQ